MLAGRASPNIAAARQGLKHQQKIVLKEAAGAKNLYAANLLKTVLLVGGIFVVSAYIVTANVAAIKAVFVLRR
ncbi:MAG: hypothetical protein U0359_09310 [Byssovorax sp.]